MLPIRRYSRLILILTGIIKENRLHCYQREKENPRGNKRTGPLTDSFGHLAESKKYIGTLPTYPSFKSPEGFNFVKRLENKRKCVLFDKKIITFW